MTTINICDICESREDVSTQRYVFGSQTDIAGGAAEDDFESFDLCELCELSILRIYVYSTAKCREDRIKYGVPMIELIKKLRANNKRDKQIGIK